MAAKRKLDSRSASVDKRFERIDERFDEVTSAMVEQREYTEFAFGSLTQEMTVGFDRVDRRIAIEVGRLDRKLDQLLEGQRLAATRRRRRPG